MHPSILPPSRPPCLISSRSRELLLTLDAVHCSRAAAAAAATQVKEGIKWMTAQVSTEYQQLEQRVRKDAAVEQEKAAKEREERMKRVAEQKAERARLAAEEEAREAAAAQVLLPDGHQRSHLLPPAPAAPCSSSSSSSATTRPHPEGGWQRLVRRLLDYRSPAAPLVPPCSSRFPLFL